jgi:lambda repressor-like predicted transcriptional regulator
MHPEQIKAAMRMKGVTPTALADELGVSNASVSQVISGRATSARIQARIAQIVGQPVEALWVPKPRLVLRRSKVAMGVAA